MLRAHLGTNVRLETKGAPNIFRAFGLCRRRPHPLRFTSLRALTGALAGNNAPEKKHMEKDMKNEKPTYLEVLASISIDENKTKWTRIGVAFPLKKRTGYSVRLEFLPVPKDKSYEFIIVEPGDRKDESGEE